MERRPGESPLLSRRAFLRSIGWAPALWIAAPFSGLATSLPGILRPYSFPLADPRFIPNYPGRPPLEDVLRLVTPGLDEFVTEKFASEIMAVLSAWSQALRVSAPALSQLESLLAASLEATPLLLPDETRVHS